MMLRIQVLDRDWDVEARKNFNEQQYASYCYRTETARKIWSKQEAAAHRSDKGPSLRSWEARHGETARHFLAYKQALWAVYMSIRTAKTPT